MRWSLSEFLQLLELRSQCWCFLDLGSAGGFRSAASTDIYFYAMLGGQATISGALDSPMTLSSGDIMLVISGHAHAVRTRPDSRTDTVAFLEAAEYADAPPTFSLGKETGSNRLLCGRLRVRWPGGFNASLMPPAIQLASRDSIVNLTALVDAATGQGATALLTRAANLIVTAALRDHPNCQMVFRDANFRDPIARAMQIMELHPVSEWTVETLARKVGMGRSSFAARFLEKRGKPPMAVLTELRMGLAAKLLTQTELKIAEIGERVGYRSESAFNRRFAAYYNTTPGKMRGSGVAPGGTAGSVLN